MRDSMTFSPQNAHGIDSRIFAGFQLAMQEFLTDDNDRFYGVGSKRAGKISSILPKILTSHKKSKLTINPAFVISMLYACRVTHAPPDGHVYLGSHILDCGRIQYQLIFLQNSLEKKRVHTSSINTRF